MTPCGSHIEHDRCKNETDRVVDEQRREHARDKDQSDDQRGRMSDARADEPGELSQPAGKPQMRHDDHHAEEQNDGPEIDRGHGSVERNRAGHHHQHGTDDGRACAIEPQEGRTTCGDDRVRPDEDQRGQHLRLGDRRGRGWTGPSPARRTLRSPPPSRVESQRRCAT